MFFIVLAPSIFHSFKFDTQSLEFQMEIRIADTAHRITLVVVLVSR